MAPLSGTDLELVREALEARVHGEDFEHALSRVLRRRDMGYDRYITLATEVRASRLKGESTEAAARRLTR